MADDISAALIYQVKKEIAERYFGARKAIEEAKTALQEHIQVHRDTVGKTVYEDFWQIYQLLQTEALVKEFWEVVGLRTRPFYDRFLEECHGIKPRLLAGKKAHGLTEKAKHRNLFLECYRQLIDDLKPYRKGYQELMEECLLINEEIAQLQANYRLSEILTFVRKIEDVDYLTGLQGQAILPAQRQDLEEKLAITKLDCLGKDVVEIPSLPSLKRVGGNLKQLTGSAYTARGAALCQTNTRF